MKISSSYFPHAAVASLKPQAMQDVNAPGKPSRADAEETLRRLILEKHELANSAFQESVQILGHNLDLRV